MLNADNRVLESIIHCELLARCKAGEDLPCSKIVAVQDVPLREQQVPRTMDRSSRPGTLGLHQQ